MHIQRISEIEPAACTESMVPDVEKNESGAQYYTVKRFYQKGDEFWWKDEGRTFDTVDQAMQYIKTRARQKERNASKKFQIFMEKPVQVVTW